MSSLLADLPLAQWREQRTFPHALLFTGLPLPQQIEQIQHLLPYILCAEQGCGKCQTCMWIQQRTHPDILWLPVSGEQTIKIDDIRNSTAHMQQSAHQGNYKIVVLAPAEAMVSAAHHALLKTLEEPPPNSIFILLSNYPGLLPATLRSRCQRWVLKTPASANENPLYTELQQTLQALQQQQLNPIKAAEHWQRKANLNEILEMCYLLGTKIAEQRLLTHTLSINFFAWLDEVNLVRQQLLRKLNPNVLLVLEYIFQRWAMTK